MRLLAHRPDPAVRASADRLGRPAVSAPRHGHGHAQPRRAGRRGLSAGGGAVHATPSGSRGVVCDLVRSRDGPGGARQPDAGRARDGAAAGHAAFPDPRRPTPSWRGATWRHGSAAAARSAPESRTCGHHAGGRSHPDLRPVRRAVAVPPAHLPVLPERGPLAGSRRSPVVTGRIGCTRVMYASGTSRRTTRGARRARSCPLWMEWPRCRWTRQRFRRDTSRARLKLRGSLLRGLS